VINEYLKLDKPYSTTTNSRETINNEGVVIESITFDNTMHFNTWSTLYDMFKFHFLDHGKAPLAVYETGKHVSDVSYHGEKIAVTYSDTKTGGSKVVYADLVIGADGGNSTVRETVLPGVTPKYVGYVTWRGSVPVASVSEASRKVLENRLKIFRTKKGYIIS
jgi:2-polyprenyl-6-methoxyphenol hydroxylase-like FAD-dependent oxidoreductase